MQQVLENGVVTVPTANPICSRKLARKAIDQMKQMDRAREIQGKFGNQKDVVSSCRANRIGADPKVGIGRGLARLGCASLVAVVKPANLRYGNYGATFWLYRNHYRRIGYGHSGVGFQPDVHDGRGTETAV